MERNGGRMERVEKRGERKGTERKMEGRRCVATHGLNLFAHNNHMKSKQNRLCAARNNVNTRTFIYMAMNTNGRSIWQDIHRTFCFPQGA